MHVAILRHGKIPSMSRHSQLEMSSSVLDSSIFHRTMAQNIGSEIVPGEANKTAVHDVHTDQVPEPLSRDRKAPHITEMDRDDHEVEPPVCIKIFSKSLLVHID